MYQFDSQIKNDDLKTFVCNYLHFSVKINAGLENQEKKICDVKQISYKYICQHYEHSVSTRYQAFSIFTLHQSNKSLTMSSSGNNLPTISDDDLKEVFGTTVDDSFNNFDFSAANNFGGGVSGAVSQLYRR